MSTTLKERIRELRSLADRMEKVLEKHPNAYLGPIAHGREEWLAPTVHGTKFEFTSDPRYPGRAGSISVHAYEEVEGIRVYASGAHRNAEYMFEELKKKDPEFYALLLSKVFG